MPILGTIFRWRHLFGLLGAIVVMVIHDVAVSSYLGFVSHSVWGEMVSELSLASRMFDQI